MPAHRRWWCPFSDHLGVVIPFPPSLGVTFSFLAKMPGTVFCLSLLCSQMAGGLLAGLKGKAQGCDGKSARPFRPSWAAERPHASPVYAAGCPRQGTWEYWGLRGWVRVRDLKQSPGMATLLAAPSISGCPGNSWEMLGPGLREEVMSGARLGWSVEGTDVPTGEPDLLHEGTATCRLSCRQQSWCFLIKVSAFRKFLYTWTSHTFTRSQR